MPTRQDGVENRNKQTRLLTMNFRVKAHRYALLSRRIRGSPLLSLETSGSHLFVLIFLIRNRVEMVLVMGIQVFSELNTEVRQVFEL